MAPSEFVNHRGFGTLWLLYGVLRIAMAAFLVVFSATARLMFGALLSRVPNPFMWMSLFMALYWIVIAWCIVCAILSFLAAGALLGRRHSAQRAGMIAALVSLPEIPFGLVLGVYTLLVIPSPLTSRL